MHILMWYLLIGLVYSIICITVYDYSDFGVITIIDKIRVVMITTILWPKAVILSICDLIKYYLKKYNKSC